MKKLLYVLLLTVLVLAVSSFAVSAEIYSDEEQLTFDENGVPVLDEYGNSLELGMKIDEDGYIYIRSDGLGASYGVEYLGYISEFDKYCDFVTSVYVDSTALSIEQETFEKFNKIEEFSLPTTLEYIGENAFKGCDGAKINFTGEKGDVIGVEAGNEALLTSNLLEAYEKVIFIHEGGCSYYLNGVKQVGFVEIFGDKYYISRVTGYVNVKTQLTIGGVVHYFNDDMTVKDGEYEEDGLIYRYNMGKKVIGWVDSDSDGVKDSYYLFSNSAKVTSDKTIGGVEYTYTDGKLVPRNGLTEIEGKTYYYKDGIKQGGFIEIDGKTYYFLRESGARVEAESYKIGGFTREFNADYSVKPISGWQEKNGYKYYYQDGEPSLGFTVIDEKTYYFFKSDNRYGIMAEGWQTIGGKVYYFFRYGSEKYGTMAIGKQTIGGNVYYFNTTGTINTGFIGDVQGNTYFYYQSNKLHGWYIISDNTYYFTLVEGYMATGEKSIGGTVYTFGDNGVLVSPSHDASNLGSVSSAGGNGFDIGSGDWSDIEFI